MNLSREQKLTIVREEEYRVMADYHRFLTSYDNNKNTMESWQKQDATITLREFRANLARIRKSIEALSAEV